MWPLCNGLYEKDQWQVGFRLVITASDWPLLTDGRCSEVVVRTGLTVSSILNRSSGLKSNITN